ncbi:glucose / Sorbosone dehydrogenase [Variibacter gotjawalensis]|uniref:Glucose / Sorbosone dehydrogenase n=1 Tax=Variibacter gotjawalensis TaxID=1333996 RepID=A0A0S3PPF0_9BRAD|nr:sorbosone dehydrogenase family protein [Variibacter gotjawalensis]NIK48070.1 glucose/arabinose dehydrogenase [Variibacter gotjawalensis]RZS49946.1 glucose/arabinose dehydrogenase [Variibacter gotjawalensis]BAT57773.1 glucose / Sorbosone dehydrogenase [Variibacter gotjawalensis]
MISKHNRWLLAGSLMLALGVTSAIAQQNPQNLPPGHPLIGQPESEAAKKLAPVAPPPIPLAADKFQLDKLKLPAGFNIELYATGVANARSMRFGDKGTLFVSTRLAGNVYAIVEKDGKREVKTIAKGLHRPNGIAFKNGSLYVAELSKVWRYDDIESKLDNPPQPVLISDKFPSDEPHGWKFIGIGPDDKLYVPVGQPCNICLPSDQHAQIRRMNLDGSNSEVVAWGVRNTVGFDWHPVTKELYFTDNGRDWTSEDLPADELNRVTKAGQHFGAPFCHQGDFPDPEFGWGKSCADYVKPVALLGPHTAALGMRFYTGASFPKQYRNQIFIARHGSWNRSTKLGGDVVVATLNKDGTVKSVAPFLTGFIQNNAYIGRPVDVVVAKDGSMLVSDDYSGAIYKITYGKKRVASR